MKALTICQPWAWAIIHAAKRIENRTWPTRYRGLLAIHAGKSRRWLIDDELPDGTRLPPDSEFIFGAVIGTAQLDDCVPIERAPDNPFAEGPWCWMLSNVRPIKPSYCRGAQGLWNWDPGAPEKHPPGLFDSSEKETT